jgi:nitroimidazol reductase NimA-like FMN-containing flavoprotein (pyridoxamine 5'-phosphate oxidase superfamily)
MANRRAQIAMSPEEVDAFLHEVHTLSVATIGPSGHPHLVAMWYGFLDDQVAFWTFAKSQKVLNLRRDPKITALAEDGTSYGTLRGVVLVGTGRIIEDFETIMRIAVSTAERQVGREAIEGEALAFLETQARKRVGVVIDVERVVSWDHTKLAGRY